jgi:hypothetical protein
MTTQVRSGDVSIRGLPSRAPAFDWWQCAFDELGAGPLVGTCRIIELKSSEVGGGPKERIILWCDDWFTEEQPRVSPTQSFFSMWCTKVIDPDPVGSLTVQLGASSPSATLADFRFYSAWQRGLFVTSVGNPVQSPTEALIAGFVRLVTRLPQVREIRIEEDGQDWRLWTLIQAEPFDRAAREPVYQAQLATLQDHPASNMSFRLVNLAEYPDVGIDELVPTDARPLWAKSE